jgi:hypothetical protein
MKVSGFDRTAVRLTIAAIFQFGSAIPLFACPFCSAPSLTLSEQVEQSVSVKLLRLESRLSTASDGASRPTVGRFRVIDEITPQSNTPVRPSDLKADQTDGTQQLKTLRAEMPSSQELQLRLAPDWRLGDLFALLERDYSGREGDVPLPVSRSLWRYLTAMPPRSEAASDRLRFFVRYLEHPDIMIANDAYGEFANARYEDIVAISDALPRARLRQWVIDSRVDRGVIETRLGLYGMLLGLCGDPSDAALLKRVIVDDWKPDDDFRLGVDGMIGGYLLLTGEDGLEIIERTKLTNPDVSFAETYAAMQALRFVWSYGDGIIDQDRLRKAMRLLLERPELTDLVIADLARWKDWELQSRLMEMYDEEAYQVPAIKRAIVRFMLVSSRSDASTSGGEQSGSDSPVPAPREDTASNAASGAEDGTQFKDDAESEPAHVALGRRCLTILRARNPKIVADCERFFMLR